MMVFMVTESTGLQMETFTMANLRRACSMGMATIVKRTNHILKANGSMGKKKVQDR